MGWGLHGSYLLQHVLQLLNQIGIPPAVPEKCLQCVEAHCAAGGPLPSGSAVVMRGGIWSTTVFGWVVHVKWYSHEWQHPRFPSRTSHCDKMTNGI